MARIDTFVKDFDDNDLSDWEDVTSSLGIAPTGSLTATGGEIEVVLAATSLEARLYAHEDSFDLTDGAWYSLEISDYDSATGSGSYYPVYVGAVHSAFSSLSIVAIQYFPGTDTLTFQSFVASASAGSVAGVANPGVPIVLGWMRSGNTAYVSYSDDSGMSWTQLFTYDMTATATAANASVWRPLMGAFSSTPSSGMTVHFDNFNVYEPPSPPLEISVPVSVVDVNADPRVRIIVGPILATDLSAVVVPVVETNAVPYDSILLGILVDLTGADPAEVEVEGVAYDSIGYGPFYVTFTPATPIVRAVAPLSIELSEADPTIDVQPAILNVGCPTATLSPIVGTFVVGDYFQYPWEIYESGLLVLDMTGIREYTVNPEDYGGFWNIPQAPRKGWLRYYTDTPGELTITGSSDEDWLIVSYEEDEYMELGFELPIMNQSIGVLTPDSIDQPSMTIDVNSGWTYFSVHSDTDDPITILWNFVPSSPQLMLEALDSSLERTPDVLTIALQGADRNEPVRFTWSPPVSDLISAGLGRPITLATITSDPEGNIHIGSLELPAAYAGTYTVRAEGTLSGKWGEVTFVIEYDPLPQDANQTAPDPIESLTLKWLWDDAYLPDRHTWVMERNPDTMSSLVKAKVLTPERTTSNGGQHVIWQGITPAKDWSFSGIILNEGEFRELEFFYNLNRKFYITTHRNKTYIVTFKSLDVKPKKNADNFWTFEYNATMILFGEKV